MRNRHGEQRLHNCPGGAYGRLLVTRLGIAPHQEVQQLALAPQFGQFQFQQASSRSNHKSSRFGKNPVCLVRRCIN